MNSFKIFGFAALSAATLLATSASAALITNGSFETGDFTGWTTNPVSFPEYIVQSPVEDGQFAAQIAGFQFGPDTLSQTVADTAGQSYALSFWYFQDIGLPSGVNVTWNGATIFSTVDTNTGGAYQHVVETVVGTGSDSLVFTAYNDPAFTYLDNVSLSLGVPEPAAWAMMLVGLGGVGAMLRRRQTKVALAI